VRCPRCDGPLRRDESLSRVQGFGPAGETVAVLACPRCVAAVTGTEAPPDRLYPPGCRMPREPGSDADLRICGLCRKALHWEDRTAAMRVPENERGVEPGVYAACGCCVEEWRYAILDRLVGAGLLPAGTPAAALAGNMLL
jgi:hypothetical protein